MLDEVLSGSNRDIFNLSQGSLAGVATGQPFRDWRDYVYSSGKQCILVVLVKSVDEKKRIK